MVSSNLQEFPNITFTVTTRSMSNDKYEVLTAKQLHASCTNVTHWDELVNFIDKNGGLKEPFILTTIFYCTLEQDELVEEYIGLYKHGQMVNDRIYGQISYNCYLSIAFKLTLEYNVKIFLVELMRVTVKEIAEHVIRPTKVIPTSCNKAEHDQLLISIHRLWRVLKMVDEREKRREGRMVGKRMILVLM